MFGRGADGGISLSNAIYRAGHWTSSRRYQNSYLSPRSHEILEICMTACWRKCLHADGTHAKVH